MKKQLSILVLLIFMMAVALVGCGKKDIEVEKTEEASVLEQLSPEMSRYQEAAKENILLLAQKNHLDMAVQYYVGIDMKQSIEGFTKKSFEEILNVSEDEEKKEQIDYPAFNPDAVEIVIPEVSEEEAEAKSIELESQNEELQKVIEEIQEELNSYKLTALL